jgi:hypothetical protein
MRRTRAGDVEPRADGRRRPGHRLDPERRMTRWLFVASLGVLMLVQLGGVSGLDGETMYAVARTAVDEQRLDVGTGYNTIEGLGDKEYSRQNAGLPLIAATLYVATAPTVRLAPRQADFIRGGAVAASMAVIVAGIVVAAYRLARTLGARPFGALIAGIGTVGGTFLLPYSKEFFAEPLAAVGLLVAIERSLADRPTAAGAGLAVAILARALSLFFLPAVLFVVARRCGVRQTANAVVPIGIGLLLTAAYNVARFGHPLLFGYQDVGFTTPFMRGAEVLLLDPAKSVFVFVPIAVLFPWVFAHLWRANRDAFLLIGSTLAITFATSATWESPQGGWCWGPRLLIPGIAPAVAAVGAWLDRRLKQRIAVVLFALGFAVSIPAVAISTQIQQLDSPPPALGPSAVRQAELVGPTAAYTAAHLYEGKDDGRNYLRYLTIWQVALVRVLGRPGAISAAIASVMIVLITAWAIARCRSAYRDVAGAASP